MARQGRRTEPLETRTGVLHDYAAIEVLLSAGEMKGRQWVFGRAIEAPRTSPTDHDILDLHIAMFGDFLPWAGATRLDDRGPGGKVPVPWNDVRIALRSFADDLARWVVGDAAAAERAVRRADVRRQGQGPPRPPHPDRSRPRPAAPSSSALAPARRRSRSTRAPCSSRWTHARRPADAPPTRATTPAARPTTRFAASMRSSPKPKARATTSASTPSGCSGAFCDRYREWCKTIAFMLSGTIVWIIAPKKAQARSRPSHTASVVCTKVGHTNW